MKNNPAVTNTKKQSRRKFLLNTTATVAALCAPSLLKGYSIAQAKTSSSGVLRVATPATPTGFDREFNVTTGDLEQSSNLATPMLTWDTAPAFGIDSNWKVYEQDAKKIAPGLAESWSLDNDGKKLILKLRQGLISNHGNELTADDAVWTYNRVHALKGASSFLFFESNYGDPKTSSFEKIDRYTFAVNASNPSVMLTRSQASVWQSLIDSTEAKKHVTTSDPWAVNWLKANPCTYGSYFVEDFKPGEQIVYRANKNFFGGPPSIEKVIYRQVPSSATRVTLLKQGEVDVATFLTPDELGKIQTAPNVRVLYFRGNYLSYIVPNQKGFEPFTDIRVRQALAYATPQKEIGAQIYNGKGNVMRSPVPETYPHYDGSGFSFDYNPAKAKELLAQAGHSKGLKFSAMYTDAIPELEILGIALQTAYRAIGVNMELDRRPPAAYFDALYGPNKQYQAALSRELAVVPDAVHATYQFFYSDSVINTAQVKDAELDEMLLASLVAPENKAPEIFSKIQRRIMEQAIWIPVWAPGNQVAIRDNVQDFTWQYNNGFTWAKARLT